ncbi:unnamed protein product [Heligmosomoides polygyrus]|uniref:Uncharacterized protein n=1 Tax=Heligmosomoides polygyrus TaxID=6339 RepID=A0A183FG54_HELPZ|nr:unnamed protein product [Heligmosomoides polygyrus]
MNDEVYAEKHLNNERSVEWSGGRPPDDGKMRGREAVAGAGSATICRYALEADKHSLDIPYVHVAGAQKTKHGRAGSDGLPSPQNSRRRRHLPLARPCEAVVHVESLRRKQAQKGFRCSSNDGSGVVVVVV